MEKEKKKYLGMTLNEMLFKSGLMQDFDDAAKKRDRTKLLEILQKIEIDTQEREKIIETILSSPEKYGY